MRYTTLLTSRREGVLQVVRAAPGVDIATAARVLGVSSSTIEYHLHHLERAGLVRRVKIGRSYALFETGGIA